MGLCLMLAAFSAGSAFAQTITVRLMNQTANRPLAKYVVQVYRIPDKKGAPHAAGQRIDKSTLPDLTLKTDATGAARFDLWTPAPDYFTVHAIVKEPRWDCYCSIRVDTEEILKSGRLVLSPGSESPLQKLTASPGEILFSLRPTPFLFRMFYPIMKG
jgi:hypothetical protein